MTTHTVSEAHAVELAKRIDALNTAQAALQHYFSAVCHGLGLPEGTQLVRVESNTMTVTHG